MRTILIYEKGSSSDAYYKTQYYAGSPELWSHQCTSLFIWDFVDSMKASMLPEPTYSAMLQPCLRRSEYYSFGVWMRRLDPSVNILVGACRRGGDVLNARHLPSEVIRLALAVMVHPRVEWLCRLKFRSLSMVVVAEICSMSFSMPVVTRL